MAAKKEKQYLSNQSSISKKRKAKRKIKKRNRDE
jgi:hypothetical protein